MLIFISEPYYPTTSVMPTIGMVIGE